LNAAADSALLDLARKQTKLVELVGSEAANYTNILVLGIWTGCLVRGLQSEVRIGQRYVPDVRGQWSAHANDISHCHVGSVALLS
jgi:hypothetical protein